MIVGFITIGWLTQWLGKKDISTTHTAATGMSLFMLAQLLLIFAPVTFAVPLWIIFGFTGTAGSIAYAALSQSFPSELSGRVTTAINLLVFVTAFCTQWLVGWVIGQPAQLGEGHDPSGHEKAVACSEAGRHPHGVQCALRPDDLERLRFEIHLTHVHLIVGHHAGVELKVRERSQFHWLRFHWHACVGVEILWSAK